MDRVRLSGNLFIDGSVLGKEIYMIVCPITKQGWGLPVENLNPEDLRILADRIEMIRKSDKDDSVKKFLIGQRVIYENAICTICKPENKHTNYDYWIDNPERGYKHGVNAFSIKPLPMNIL